MNVTEANLRSYIELYHETLSSTAAQFLPEDQQAQLLHSSLLPARIIGYVSTQFGAAIEYVTAEQTSIETVRGSGRIEDLLVGAPSAFRQVGPMFRVAEAAPNFYNTGGIFGLTLEGAFPFRLAGLNSGFRVGDALFKMGPWRRHVRYAEVFGNRSLEFWDRDRAVARAKDEVLAALAQSKRAEQRLLSLPEYIAKFKERSVLLLGDYGEDGIERLRSLASALIASGYEPILVSEVPDIPQQDLSQKVATLGSLARFVMVDDSTKSGHLVEVQLCRTYNWLTILLRHQGKAASWMTAGASASSNLVLELDYELTHLDDAVTQASTWAEARIAELGRRFDSTFPWRMRA